MSQEMGAQYRSREGEATAVDTKTALTTLGPDTAPGALNVPSGKSKLEGMWVACDSNGAATGSYSAFIRLEGSGLTQPYIIPVGAGGGSVATGQAAVIAAVWVQLDSDVNVNNEILIFAEMAGADVGQLSFGVTLKFV